MQPVDTVKYYGKDFMEAIRRKMIPKDVFKGFALPSGIKMPGRNFATGGMVAATNSATYSVNVPVNINGARGIERISGVLQKGIEDTVINIMRKEFR